MRGSGGEDHAPVHCGGIERALYYRVMGKYGKLVQKVLSGRQDTSILFSEAVGLLQALGFSMRIKGSHHIFTSDGIDEIINIQPDGSKAKAYQVKQMRGIMLKYRLEAQDE